MNKRNLPNQKVFNQILDENEDESIPKIIISSEEVKKLKFLSIIIIKINKFCLKIISIFIILD